MFLASIIADKDNQQWRCWPEKVTISARDPWRGFVKNTVIQLRLKKKGGKPIKLFLFVNIQLCTTYMAGGMKSSHQTRQGGDFLLGFNRRVYE